MFPQLLLHTVVLVEYPLPLKSAHDVVADPRLHHLGVVRIDVRHRDKPRAALRIRREYTFNDASSKVRVLVE
jgi:hypothetical protein